MSTLTIILFWPIVLGLLWALGRLVEACTDKEARP